MLAVTNDTFDPVLLSLEENAFLLEHLGKPPQVVAKIVLPVGVNPKAIMPVVQTVYDLSELEKHDNDAWTGLAVIKARIQTYLEQREGWAAMKRRGGKDFPAFPSMAGWDARGKPHMGATGSDAQQVRTYFDAEGERQPFAVSLHDTGIGEFRPPWIKGEKSYDALEVDDVKGAVTCPICAHAETFNLDSQSSRNLAQARMATHLVSAKKDPNAHKALHTKVFG